MLIILYRLGLLHRNVKLLSYGIRPIWVFDGKPPQMKGHIHRQRKERKDTATKIFDQAVVDEDVELQYKMSSRLVRVSKTQQNDAIKLLKLMGIPTFLAPGEAEAQCTTFVKENLAVAVGSEDLD